MITRTMARKQGLPSPPDERPGAVPTECELSSPTSPYSLTNEDMNQLTEELDEQGDLTTLGRTYEELVNASHQEESQLKQSKNARPRDTIMSDDIKESEDASRNRGRQSAGVEHMLGRNSSSNCSTVGGGPAMTMNAKDDDLPSSVHIEQEKPGWKNNLNRHSLNWESPTVLSADHGNFSQRRSHHVNTSRGQPSSSNARFSRPSHDMATGRRRPPSLNQSHISSSSSSGMEVSGEDNLGDSWSPIRSSPETSFAKEAGNAVMRSSPENRMIFSPNKSRSSIGQRKSGSSLSPIRGSTSSSFSEKNISAIKSPTGRSSSPKRGPSEKSDGSGLSWNKGESSSVQAGATGQSPIRGKLSCKFSPKNLSKSFEKRSLSPKMSPTEPSESAVRSPLGSLSPKRSPSRRRSTSPKREKQMTPPNQAHFLNSTKQSKSRSRSPTRSPLGDISPNRARSKSPKRAGSLSPLNKTVTSANSPKKPLSPNGTYSLMEAKGDFLCSSQAKGTATGSSDSDMSVSSGSRTTSSSETSAMPNVSMLKGDLASASASNKGCKMQLDAANTDIMYSPERKSAGYHARSTAPTPNSQRRVLKRFRASVPTANYLSPEDLLDESMEMNPNREENINAQPVCDSCSDHGETSGSCQKLEVDREMESIPEPAYENAFEFPSDTPLHTKTLMMFHDRAILAGSASHQYVLNQAGTNQLSLQEVILPSIAYEVNAALKQKQAIAQRKMKDGMDDSQGKEVVEAIKTCRKVVNRCTGEAAKVAGESWRKRQLEREQSIRKSLEKEKEQRRLERLKAKKERKEARARARQEKYERLKREKRMNDPRNKALWQEVAKLMVDIQKLEKEERMWKDASAEVKRMKEHLQPPEKLKLGPIAEEEEEMVKDVKNANLESTSNTLVEDFALATERINCMLKRVTLAMDESEKLRKEAFDKYQYDGHKLHGYPDADDPKGLFLALSMESP